jgi:hypothetical protein
MDISQILNIKQCQYNQYKVHFAACFSDTEDPLIAYYNGNFEQWQDRSIGHLYDNRFILSFVKNGDHEWLFAGVYETTQQNLNGLEVQQSHLIDFACQLIGRLVIKYDKFHRKQLVNLESCILFMEFVEILREKRIVNPFSGFQEAKVNFKLLSIIVKNEVYSWKQPLSNYKGIYLITDIKTGRMYVGAAFGEQSFWDRWVDYAKRGHGGNKALMKMIALNGSDYVENFQFSFLEVKDLYTTNNVVLHREAFWKDVLMTREFGYNIV